MIHKIAHMGAELANISLLKALVVEEGKTEWNCLPNLKFRSADTNCSRKHYSTSVTLEFHAHDSPHIMSKVQ